MKAFIFACSFFLAPLSAIGGPQFVTEIGIAYEGDGPNLQELAAIDAERKAIFSCGGFGQVTLDGNLAFEQFPAFHCPSPRFCRPRPPGVTATGKYLCPANN
jgi:hypothetical protein